MVLWYIYYKWFIKNLKKTEDGTINPATLFQNKSYFSWKWPLEKTNAKVWEYDLCNSITDCALRCHFPPRREKEELSTNLCRGKIKMACNSSPLTATDLEMICFAVRMKQSKINQFTDLLSWSARPGAAWLWGNVKSWFLACRSCAAFGRTLHWWLECLHYESKKRLTMCKLYLNRTSTHPAHNQTTDVTDASIWYRWTFLAPLSEAATVKWAWTLPGPDDR